MNPEAGEPSVRLIRIKGGIWMFAIESSEYTGRLNLSALTVLKMKRAITANELKISSEVRNG